MIMVGRTHDAQNNHRKSHIFSEAGRPNNERIFAIFGDPLIVIFTISKCFTFKVYYCYYSTIV